MSELNCPDCFKEQRSRNDILKSTIDNAKKFANEQKCKVAIFQEGQGFVFQKFTGEVPEGTIDIITPD